MSVKSNKNVKLTNGICYLAKLIACYMQMIQGLLESKDDLQVVAHELNIFVSKYKMKVCTNRTKSNVNV
jgi:hypothetical protein